MTLILFSHVCFLLSRCVHFYGQFCHFFHHVSDVSVHKWLNWFLFMTKWIVGVSVSGTSEPRPLHLIKSNLRLVKESLFPRRIPSPHRSKCENLRVYYIYELQNNAVKVRFRPNDNCFSVSSRLPALIWRSRRSFSFQTSFSQTGRKKLIYYQVSLFGYVFSVVASSYFICDSGWSKWTSF